MTNEHEPDHHRTPDRDPTDWDSGNPVGRVEGTGASRGSALEFSWWNLILLVPLAMLVTAVYNHDEPRLFGMPLFYWYQLAFVFVGVAAVGIVYAATRKRRPPRDNAGASPATGASGE